MFTVEYWKVSTFFAIGVIVGLSYLLLSDSSERQHAPNGNATSSAAADKIHPSALDTLKNKNPVSRPEGLVRNSSLSISELIKEGDSLLITGNFSAAALHFSQAQQQAEFADNSLTLRLAFCAEYRRQFKVATEYYDAVLDNQPSEIQRWTALSGISRCWTERGNRTEAVSILCDLYLQCWENPNKIPDALRSQVAFQLGNTLQEITLQNYHYDLSRPDGVAFHYQLPWVEEMLVLVKPTQPGEASKIRGERTDLVKQSREMQSDDSVPLLDDGGLKITVQQRPSDSLDLITVNIDTPMVSLTELLKQLTAVCELELLISAEAESLLTARSKSINANGIPVSLILDAVLLPLNILWVQDERGLNLISLTESGSIKTSFFPAATERVFRRFANIFPGDYRLASGLLSRANLKLIQGDLNQAATHYQELLKREPKDELLAKVFFNFGKIEMRLGRNDQALKQMYRCADQSYNRDLRSSAYWLISQLCLEARQLPESIKTAGRALALAQIDEQKRLAALTLARAYLLSNQPTSANQVLYDNRDSFAGSSLEAAAGVVGCLARYLATAEKNSHSSEANRLLSAIAMARHDQFEHFIDIYIAARGWLELGFRDKAIEMLTLAADSTTISAWRRQFLFELGVQLVFSNQAERAIPVFEFVVAGEEDIWMDRALVHLASLYADSSRYEDAIAIGERLIKRPVDENLRNQALQSMGKSYRELGQHHTAALCFAGLVPNAVDIRHTQ